MITTADQYNSNLHLLYNTNPPAYVMLPTPDNTYNIDIKTREIDAPQFLAVEKDSQSETIYFIVDRYAGFMDLALTNCIITYTNALGKTRIYNVPFYDIYSHMDVDSKNNKILIPWCLDANVTEAPGQVQFYITFFKVKEVTDRSQATNDKIPILSYCLNTLPATSKVLSGMTANEMSEEYMLDSTQYMDLLNRINIASNWVTHPTTWTVLQ